MAQTSARNFSSSNAFRTRKDVVGEMAAVLPEGESGSATHSSTQTHYAAGLERCGKHQ